MVVAAPVQTGDVFKFWSHIFSQSLVTVTSLLGDAVTARVKLLKLDGTSPICFKPRHRIKFASFLVLHIPEGKNQQQQKCVSIPSQPLQGCFELG